MHLEQAPKYHISSISKAMAVWRYRRFNDSYRDIAEELAYRRIVVSHETIYSWCIKFASYFKNVIRKRESEPKDRWHLDEMTIKINGEYYVLWRAVDADGHKLDIFLQKHRIKSLLYVF